MPNAYDVDAIAAVTKPAIQESDGVAAVRISSYLSLYEYLAAGVRADDGALRNSPVVLGLAPHFG